MLSSASLSNFQKSREVVICLNTWTQKAPSIQSWKWDKLNDILHER